ALMYGPNGKLVSTPPPSPHPTFTGVTISGEVGVMAYAIGLLDHLPADHFLRRQVTEPFLVGDVKPAVVLGFADRWRTDLPREESAAYRARDFYPLDAALLKTRQWETDRKADEDKRRREEEQEKREAQRRLEQTAEYKEAKLKAELAAAKERQADLER